MWLPFEGSHYFPKSPTFFTLSRHSAIILPIRQNPPVLYEGVYCMKAVITVIGHDTVGVVAKVSAVCAELNINIEDITQSIMQDMFCMIMLVDLARCNVDHVAMRDRFTALGAEMKMQVTVTRQEVFDAMHTI